MALSTLFQNRATYATTLRKYDFEEEPDNEECFDEHIALASLGNSERVRDVVYADREGADRKASLVLCRKGVEDTTEAVFVLRGYVTNADLPPILQRSQLPKQAHKAKQRICLTGLGTKTFTTAATAIQMLWQVLSEEAPRSALQAWTPRQAHGMLELEFSNRYFCLGRDMPATEQVAISDTVDPFSILRRLCPSNHSSSDNEVHYFERRTDQKSGKARHARIKPNAVRVGQLVEVQVSFQAVPVAKGKYQMLQKLRAICILDRTVEEDFHANHLSTISNAIAGPSLKRRIGYDVEECDGVESSRQGIKRLRIDEEQQYQEGSDGAMRM